MLGNDTDVDGDPLTAVLVSGPAHGTLALNAERLLQLHAGGELQRADSFTYKANDGSADSNVATVSITVNAANDAPVAQNDSVTTKSGQASSIELEADDVEGTRSPTGSCAARPTAP